MLGSSERPLQETYDVAVLDLDGVVYVGPDAVPGAPEALNAAQAGGMHLAFVTNNAARPPQEIAGQLRAFGVDAHDEDVVTSSQAAARLLSTQLEQGSKVYLIGGTGLEQALRERGLEPVTEPDDDVAAVVQGYGPDMPWKRVVRGAVLLNQGLPWVASNTDMTFPTAKGVGPGNGALVELLARFSGREPQVAGKPKAPLFEETITRVGGRHPLVVGDRLDTDIEGAVTMGWDSLLVLTGVTGLEELVSATKDRRPTYVGPDLGALAEAQTSPEVTEGAVALGGWTVSVGGGRPEIEGAGSAGDWWRAVAVAAWRHLDDTGQPVEIGDVQVPQ
ncbi:HAD-IIA family hydrolase [Marmoricola sp. URHB0036]|uniref:HAD-IIA family hydrolase n=1 Tax=Marmoricola sp. URHB0036 TaxID=1298863 RepID=UPI00040DD3D5|nr:HAD-IIA family hydrolase [Marmoricola sp. URHB0036]